MDTSTINPFWGPPTSYLNFCEQDYVVTRYVAEFINTLSSLTYVAYGLFGLSRIQWNDQANIRAVLYAGLIGVGLCSGAYHMTLKYHTQMSDELSMHLLTTPLLYRVLTFNSSVQRTRVIGIGLTLVFTVVMTVHMVMDEFVVHATSFGLEVVIIIIRVTQLIPEQVTEAQTKNKLQRIARFGCASFVFGYIVWLIDEFACSALTSTRDTIGLPFAFFLELHGWWHVFTAIGAYVAVALVDEITSEQVREDAPKRMAWPVPLVSRILSNTGKSSKQT